ncbi:hypothetical protein B0H14DRAFT_3500178 [Mycena olivaceomarginata]|nr:hypothetical protein B0H14DRAFT_3500178 [Mycena olivaceomarginata]
MFSVTLHRCLLVLAGVASANPVTRAACNPALAGLGISIASGSLEIGYGSSVAGRRDYLADIIGYRDVNQPNQAAGLFPTWVNGVIELETLVTPQDG